MSWATIFMQRPACTAKVHHEAQKNTFLKEKGFHSTGEVVNWEKITDLQLGVQEMTAQ